MDIPGVGRFAVVTDPHGATFKLFPAKRRNAEGPVHGAGPDRLARTNSREWRKAFEFYSQMFGWTKTEAMDMGALGVYQLFASAARMRSAA